MEFYLPSYAPSVATAKVSIPNGMEFYAGLATWSRKRTIEFQFPTGWNSTSRARACIAFCWRFQFPTGWNSTLYYFLEIVFAIAGFNSQRDGILLSRIDIFWRSRIVSIPNGMEFYRGKRKLWDQRKRFQFPTGWNSTWLAALYLGILRCFNSQRDGILR